MTDRRDPDESAEAKVRAAWEEGSAKGRAFVARLFGSADPAVRRRRGRAVGVVLGLALAGVWIWQDIAAERRAAALPFDLSWGATRAEVAPRFEVLAVEDGAVFDTLTVVPPGGAPGRVWELGFLEEDGLASIGTEHAAFPGDPDGAAARARFAEVAAAIDDRLSMADRVQESAGDPAPGGWWACVAAGDCVLSAGWTVDGAVTLLQLVSEDGRAGALQETRFAPWILQGLQALQRRMDEGGAAGEGG